MKKACSVCIRHRDISKSKSLWFLSFHRSRIAHCPPGDDNDDYHNSDDDGNDFQINDGIGDGSDCDVEHISFDHALGFQVVVIDYSVMMMMMGISLMMIKQKPDTDPRVVR